MRESGFTVMKTHALLSKEMGKYYMFYRLYQLQMKAYTVTNVRKKYNHNKKDFHFERMLLVNVQ